MGRNLNCDLHLTKISPALLLYFGCNQLRVGNWFCTDTSGLTWWGSWLFSSGNLWNRYRQRYRQSDLLRSRSPKLKCAFKFHSSINASAKVTNASTCNPICTRILITCFSSFLSEYHPVLGHFLFLFGLETRSSSMRTSPHKNFQEEWCPYQSMLLHQLSKLMPLKAMNNTLLTYLPTKENVSLWGKVR
jgi:hypothetical protein